MAVRMTKRKRTGRKIADPDVENRMLDLDVALSAAEREIEPESPAPVEQRSLVGVPGGNCGHSITNTLSGVKRCSYCGQPVD